MKKSVCLSVCLICFVLAGCLVGPDYERPVFFSDKRIEKALDLKPTATMPLHTIDFNDATLRQLIDMAQRNAPTIRLALIRLRQARQNTRITSASLGPTFDLTAMRQFEKQSPNMDTLVKEDYYQSGIDVAWELDIWGGTRRRIEVAQANEIGAIESLKNIYVSLSAEVALTYIDLRTQEELLKRARENLNIQQDVYQLTSDLLSTGLSNAIDANQAKYLVDSTKAGIPQYEYKITVAQNTLSYLVGVLPGELNELLKTPAKNLIAQPIIYPIDQLRQLPTNVLRNRPDVRTAEQNLIAQNATVGAAIADLYPSVSLSAFLGFESLHADNLLNHRSYGYFVSPKISQPLFHFGALKNNVALQKEIKAEYVVLYEQQLLQAAKEVRNALVSIEQEQKSNQSYRASYKRISEAASLTRNKYQNGLVSYESVLNSEQRRIQAQTDLIQSNSTLYQNIVQFYKAIGGNANRLIMR